MPETRECDVCASIVKHIPAGTSKKTGKHYNDFWVCSNDNCSSRQRSTQNTQTPARSQPSENNSTMNGSIAIFEVLQAIRALLEQLVNNSVSNKEETWKPTTSSTESEPPSPTEE